jgi:hypothetical protein
MARPAAAGEAEEGTGWNETELGFLAVRCLIYCLGQDFGSNSNKYRGFCEKMQRTNLQ